MLPVPDSGVRPPPVSVVCCGRVSPNLGDPAPRRPLTAGERVTVAILLMAFAGLILADLLRGPSPVKWSVLFVLMAWSPLLVIHEFGHALAAYVAGWSVHRVVIGMGKTAVRFRIGSTKVAIKRIPLEGFVVPVPTDLRWARLKNAWIYMAGPGMEVLVLLACIALAGYPDILERSTSLSMIAYQSICVAVGIGLAFNLIPHRAADGIANDGLGMIASFGLSKSFFLRAMTRPLEEEVERLLERGEAERALGAARTALTAYPDSLGLRILSSLCLAAAGRCEEALAAFDALESAANANPPASRMALWHGRGKLALEVPERELLRDGELACDKALEADPDWPSCEVTLGCILVERGRIEEAMTRLNRALARVRDEHDQARAFGYLALAMQRAGERERAALYLDALRDSDPSPRLLARVEREFAGSDLEPAEARRI